MSNSKEYFQADSRFSYDNEPHKFYFFTDVTRGNNKPKAVIDEGLDDLEAKHPQKNSFFTGAVIAVPISLFLWGAIIFTLKLIY